MNQEKFSVSVIIPVYNGEKFLAGAIKNVLAQNYQPSEIIVVNDGSTDNTANVAVQFKDDICYVYQTNKGASAARNKGIEIAQGNVIAFLDVDDLWSENALEILIEALANNPSAEIVQGLIQQVQLFESLHNKNDFVFEEVSKAHPYVLLGSAIYRKTVFDKVGLLDESLPIIHDTDWFVRAWENNISKFIVNEVTLFYCRHDQNITWGHNLIHNGFPEILKRHLDRRRQQKNFTMKKPANFPKLIDYLGKGVETKASEELKNKQFTIICNDGFLTRFFYKDFFLASQTPLINTKIEIPCYLKLLKNLRHYLDSPLKFINYSRYDHVNQQRKEKNYLLGLLGEEIEIQFPLATDKLQINRDWNSTLKRLEWNNLFIVFSLLNIQNNDINKQIIEDFENIDLPNKLCFTPKEYSGFNSIFFIPEIPSDEQKTYFTIKKHFKIINWLNRKHGTNPKDYKK